MRQWSRESGNDTEISRKGAKTQRKEHPEFIDSLGTLAPLRLCASLFHYGVVQKVPGTELIQETYRGGAAGVSVIWLSCTKEKEISTPLRKDSIEIKATTNWNPCTA
jgi:hypothetical protein